MDRIIHNDQTLWARENSEQALAEAITRTAQAGLKADPNILHDLVAAQYSWRRFSPGCLSFIATWWPTYHRP
jgi:alpha-1,6-mannosyltransferase